MIEEQFVSFDTAKILKEAGFDVPCRGIYRAYRIGTSVFHEYDRKSAKDDLCRNAVDGFQYEYLAPTQAMAARWLREVHNIDVMVDVYNRNYYICNVYKNKHLMIIRNIVTSSFEEAFEEGLCEAIKLIKK